MSGCWFQLVGGCGQLWIGLCQFLQVLLMCNSQVLVKCGVISCRLIGMLVVVKLQFIESVGCLFIFYGMVKMMCLNGCCGLFSGEVQLVGKVLIWLVGVSSRLILLNSWVVCWCILKVWLKLCIVLILLICVLFLVQVWIQGSILVCCVLLRSSSLFYRWVCQKLFRLLSRFWFISGLMILSWVLCFLNSCVVVLIVVWIFVLGCRLQLGLSCRLIFRLCIDSGLVFQFSIFGGRLVVLWVLGCVRQCISSRQLFMQWVIGLVQ